MRIYVSASYHRQADLRPIRDKLAAMGHVVTSSWIGEETTIAEKWRGNVAAFLRRRLGIKDLAEIMACDLFINDQSVPSVSGGLHCELGMALALAHTRFYEMQIWTVGYPPEGITRSPFFEMVDRHYENWDKLLEAL